ncbi:MAG: arylsulfatase [Verrucomicrobiales bacterium]|nr:arylsulfatase [Verrucomicrobiales bacterium]
MCHFSSQSISTKKSFLPWLPALILLLSFLLVHSSTASDHTRPNVILIITDDQGYGDLSCHGNPRLKTPNLDRLYHQSLRLTDYHVSPTCAPTRAALMSGHYSNRTGVWHTINGRSIIRANEVLMPQIFSDSGYRTAMYGKWHLGDNYPSRPEDRGFQEVFRHGGGGIGQTPDHWNNAYFDCTYTHNDKKEKVSGYCTDVYFDQAMQWMKARKKQKQPFFTYLATNAPHGPNHSPSQFSKPYADLGIKTANFLGMISNIDDNMGKLMRFLDDEQLSGNTILIFTTDNGTAGGDKLWNAGMRAKKGSEYEGGHRVPFFIRWPNGNLGAGRDLPQLTSHIDILPTFIELLHLKNPTNLNLDGRSLVPLLNGNDKKWLDRFLITDSQRIRDPEKWRKSAVMASGWRLINGKELYDINTDPGQKENLAKAHPEKVNQFRQAYEQWWASMEGSFKDDVEIVIGNDRENPATLTAHDWFLYQENAPWNHSGIRSKKGAKSGYWNIKVDQSARYQIQLRRWPKESEATIGADLAPGADVPGVPAYRTTPGKGFAAILATLTIGDQHLKKVIADAKKEKYVTFELDLKAGDTQLSGLFIDAEGNKLGSYYAYVKRL